MKKILSVILIAVVVLGTMPAYGRCDSADLFTCESDIRAFSNFIIDNSIDVSTLQSLYTSLSNASSKLTAEDLNSSDVQTCLSMIRVSLDSITSTLKSCGYGDLSSAMKTVNKMYMVVDGLQTGAVVNTSVNSTSASSNSVSFSNFNFNASPLSFSDVPSTAWYFDPVSKASASGIINGKGNNMFAPTENLTVAEAITLASKVNAIYYNRLDELNGYLSSHSGTHWAQGALDYCNKYNLFSTPSTQVLNSNCTRQDMAFYFYNALPEDAFTKINDVSLASETPQTPYIKALFEAGILIGDSQGFRPYDNIIRAEAATLIYREASHSARVQVSQSQSQSLNQGTSTQTPQTEITSNTNLTYTRPVHNIPATHWTSDPFTGQLNIQPHSNVTWWTPDISRNADGTVSGTFSSPINTLYGRHTYNSRNQEEYDYVMSVVEDAYIFATSKATINGYDGKGFASDYEAIRNLGLLRKSVKGKEHIIQGKVVGCELITTCPYLQYLRGEISENELYDFYMEVYTEEEIGNEEYWCLPKKLGLTSREEICNFMRTQETIDLMRYYMTNVHAENMASYKASGGQLASKTVHGYNSVYDWLKGTAGADCDGDAAISMVILDYLGFNTREVASDIANHGAAEVQVNGQWIAVDGCISWITHSELLYAIQEAYKGNNCEDLKIRGTVSEFTERYHSAATDLEVDIGDTYSNSFELGTY